MQMNTWELLLAANPLVLFAIMWISTMTVLWKFKNEIITFFKVHYKHQENLKESSIRAEILDKILNHDAFSYISENSYTITFADRIVADPRYNLKEFLMLWTEFIRSNKTSRKLTINLTNTTYINSMAITAFMVFIKDIYTKNNMYLQIIVQKNRTKSFEGFLSTLILLVGEECKNITIKEVEK